MRLPHWLRHDWDTIYMSGDYAPDLIGIVQKCRACGRCRTFRRSYPVGFCPDGSWFMGDGRKKETPQPMVTKKNIGGVDFKVQDDE